MKESISTGLGIASTVLIATVVTGYPRHCTVRGEIPDFDDLNRCAPRAVFLEYLHKNEVHVVAHGAMRPFLHDIPDSKLCWKTKVLVDILWRYS